MSLAEYRESDLEKLRASDLLTHMPEAGQNALDVGARDGHFSCLMAERFSRVTALDLECPRLSHPKISCEAGDAVALRYSDRSFDFVLCAEVLEHIPEPALSAACKEIVRVSSRHILIGVPFKQDIRVGRTTCVTCARPNPPWGHVNSFDLPRLRQLFNGCDVGSVSYVGVALQATNAVSTRLMDFAGNPYGTYSQDEPCVYCGLKLLPPQPRTPLQRVATRLSVWSRRMTEVISRPHPNWIHVLFTVRVDP
jgi:Methyltransferase domain